MKHTLEATKLILIILSAVMLTSCFYKKASSPADETTDTQPQTTETQPQTTETQPQTTETQPQTTETQPQTTEPVITTEIDLEKLEYSIEMPSEELEKRFVEEFIVYQKNRYGFEEEHTKDAKIEYWLGSYGDIHFLFIIHGAYPQMEWVDNVAGYKFNYPDYQPIEVWVNGQFLTIKNAYEKNMITKDMVAKIADVYKHRDYLVVHGYDWKQK